LRLAPDDVDAHFELGSVLAQNGRRDEAAVHFREALRLRPDHALAREALQKLDAPAPK
jgi:Flp pilus assembly protein TadD